MDNYFSTNLKFLREKNNLLQNELAKKYVIKNEKTGEIKHVSRAAIGLWENKDREPNMDIVIQTADIFGLPVAELISKDLRTVNNNFNQEEANMLMLRKVLIEKRFMSGNEDLSNEELINVIEFIKANKKFILSKDESDK